MNVPNLGANENLKRKNEFMYPDIFTGHDKKRGVNKEKNQSKQKFNFTTITNHHRNTNLKTFTGDKLNNVTSNAKNTEGTTTKTKSNSISHFHSFNLSKNKPVLSNTRNTNLLNQSLNDRSSINKAERSLSFNSQQNPTRNNINPILPLKPRAISEKPESQRNKIANHPIINTKEMLADYWGCGGDLNNLRERIKNKKKSKISENESEIKENIQEIKKYIKNTNNYISNIYKNYTERYRSSVGVSMSDHSVGENTNKILIEDNDDTSSKKDLIQFEKSNHYTEPRVKNSNDSSSKRRLSLPNNLQYSSELYQYYSTDLSESIMNEATNMDKDSDMFVENVNKFSLDCDQENLENYYKDNLKTDEVEDLNQQQLEVMEIINTKIKDKQNDFKFVIENFDLLIENDSKKKEENDRIIQGYSENQVILMKNLMNLENSLKNKASQINSLSMSLTELMNELERGESHRRKLHNYIQELRGNIRAFCRVKPPTAENLENEQQIFSAIRYPELASTNSSSLIQSNKMVPSQTLYSLEIINKDTNSANNSSSVFHFDRIFTEASTQKEIFHEVKPFIQSALDGENVCIFAYGPTGSGKTYTMQGPSWALEDKEFTINEFTGILPRSACYIFDELTRLNLFNYTCKVSISAIEIYNENIYDLFDCSNNKQPLQIFFAKNIVQLKNLIWHQIHTKEDVLKYTKDASETRRSDTTKYNDNSSRSHAIYQLKLEFVKNNKQIESYINIIDLAGSEKCSLTSFNNKSDKEIEVMKKLQNESNFINKSLSTLGRIISMLADKKMSKLSIPYRESKLTMILQNSLRANSKTAMIVTICSDLASLQQSKETLKFATNAMMAC